MCWIGVHFVLLPLCMFVLFVVCGVDSDHDDLVCVVSSD